MRKQSPFSVLALSLVLFPALVYAGLDNPWDIRLPFKEAVVHYTIKGMESGTETLYIKDYGRRSAKYHKTSTSMMGVTVNNETVEITTLIGLTNLIWLSGPAARPSIPQNISRRSFPGFPGRRRKT